MVVRDDRTRVARGTNDRGVQHRGVQHPVVRARRAFRALDLDGSGSLCQVEIRKLLHLFNIELTDGDWKKCWAWMDMDGSGALDINEFFVRFGSDHGTMLSIGDELKHLSADGAAPKKSPRRPSEPKSQGAPVPL